MSDLTTGIFGLVGAAVGGVGTYWSARKANQFETDREERRRVRQREEELRIAVRSLLGDLELSRDRLKRSLEDKQYWSEQFGMPTGLWDKHRDVIARDLSAQEWATIHTAFRLVNVQEARSDMARRKYPEKSRPPLGDFAAGQFAITLEQIGGAIEVLRAADERDSEHASRAGRRAAGFRRGS
jgi:hypothetical protein